MGIDVEYVDDDGIVVFFFSIFSVDGCCIILGCYVYYLILFGQMGVNFVWYVVIVMNKIIMEVYWFYEFVSIRVLIIFQLVKMDNGSGNLQWFVMMSVLWEDVVFVFKLVLVLLNEFQSIDVIQVGWWLYYYLFDGMDQWLKLQCLDGFIFVQVKGFVCGCIKDVVRFLGMLLFFNVSLYFILDILVIMFMFVFGGDN